MATIQELRLALSGSYDNVATAGQGHRQRPVSLLDCFDLCERFPGFRSAFFGDEGGEKTLVSVAENIGVEGVIAFIARSMSWSEKRLSSLSDEDRLIALSNAIRLSMPLGIDEFFDIGNPGKRSTTSKPRRVRRAMDGEIGPDDILVDLAKKATILISKGFHDAHQMSPKQIVWTWRVVSEVEMDAQRDEVRNGAIAGRIAQADKKGWEKSMKELGA